MRYLRDTQPAARLNTLRPLILGVLVLAVATVLLGKFLFPWVRRIVQSHQNQSADQVALIPVTPQPTPTAAPQPVPTPLPATATALPGTQVLTPAPTAPPVAGNLPQSGPGDAAIFTALEGFAVALAYRHWLARQRLQQFYRNQVVVRRDDA